MLYERRGFKWKLKFLELRSQIFKLQDFYYTKRGLLMKKWEVLTAVIQSENLKNCTSRSLQRCIGELNSDNLKLDQFITPNVLVFRAKNPKKAGQFLESWLLRNFKPKKSNQLRRTTIAHNGWRKIYIIHINLYWYMNDDLKLLKALALETRYKIIKLLLNGERCACEIPKLIGRTQSNTSMHLAKLAALGILQSRRNGKMIRYSIKDLKVCDIFKALGYFEGKLLKTKCCMENKWTLLNQQLKKSGNPNLTDTSCYVYY